MDNDYNAGSEVIQILLLTENSNFTNVCRDYEILFVLSGSVSVSTDNSVKKVTKGHIISINPGTNRTYALDKNALAAIFVISRIKLWRIAIGHSILIECDSISNGLKCYDKLRFYLKQALSCHLQDNIFDKLKMYSCYYDILKELIEKHSNWNTMTNTDDKSEHETRVLTIIEYIHSNFYKQTSLMDLAEHLNLSPSYLSKFIKNNLGIGFLEFLNQTRLQYAVDDLLKTNLPISKIAFDNGFPNFSSFNRVFKEIYNTTPTEYKKANKVLISKDSTHQVHKNRSKMCQLLNDNDNLKPQSDYFTFTADVRHGVPYIKYWNEVYSLGPAFDLLNSDVQNHVLHLKREFNFKYLHISGIFSKDLLIDLRATHGFNFSRINRILDLMTENGIIPFIDIGFQPWGLIGQSNSQVVYEDFDLYGFSTSQYEALITEFISQCIKRYGHDEVSEWRFDLFHNESQPISDSQQPLDSYLSFFKAAYICIKKLVPAAKVGGCGTYTYDTTDFNELVSALSHNKLIPDFFSVQIYPYDLTKYRQNDLPKGGLAGQHFEVSSDPEYVFRKVQHLRNILSSYGFSPEHLIVVGWNMSLSARNFINDSSFKGAYIVKNLISCLGQTNIMSYEGITDLLYEHFSPTLQLFGGYGLLSKDGIRKPAYYAFDFMNRLGDLLILKETHFIATKDVHDRIYIVFHNCGTLSSSYYSKFHDDVGYQDVASLTEHEPINITLQISGLPNKQYLLKKYIIGENDGSALNEWIRLGYIENVGRDEIEYLSSICIPRQWSETTTKQSDIVSVSTTIPTNEIQFIQLLPLFE